MWSWINCNYIYVEFVCEWEGEVSPSPGPLFVSYIHKRIKASTHINTHTSCKSEI